MAILGITATEDGPRSATGEADLSEALGSRLARLPARAPIVVLIHGYRFDPARPEADPHRSIFAVDAPVDRRTRGWPAGLGFADDAGETGLCLGFGWPATPPAHLPTLLRSGRTGFAAVYDRAAENGARLAELIALVQRLAPDRPVDILAHSLGARVALSALPLLARAPGRVILLGAAEFDARALDFLAAAPSPRPARVYNVTARANDVYDAAFEMFAPRGGRGERAVGQGLRAAPPNWIDLQIDRAEVTGWINARGVALTPAQARLCHWSFYTRDGAFAVYEAILRRRPGWDIRSLRAIPDLTAQDPRWSRILPRARPVGAGSGFRDLTAPAAFDGA